MTQQNNFAQARVKSLPIKLQNRIDVPEVQLSAQNENSKTQGDVISKFGENLREKVEDIATLRRLSSNIT